MQFVSGWWRTKDGKWLAISEIETDHLKNVLRLLNRAFRMAVEVDDPLACWALQLKMEEIEEELGRREFWEDREDRTKECLKTLGRRGCQRGRTQTPRIPGKK